MHPCRKFLLAAFLCALPCFHTHGQSFHDLGVELTHSPQPLSSGYPFTLTLLITNGGPVDAHDVAIYLYHEDLFYPGEELWFLSTPAEFENSDGSVKRDLTRLPARTAVAYSLAAVALLPGDHLLYASAHAGEEASDILNNFAAVTFSVSQGPGLITLDKPAYMIPESGAGLINVRRLGGDDTPVAVSFATSNGTAIALSHFVPAAGRLEFGPGELTKTIHIPAIYDPLPSCNKSLTLHLFNSEGGAPLLRYTNAALAIADTPSFAGYVRPVSTNFSDALAANPSSPRLVSADGRKLVFVQSHTVGYDDNGIAIRASHIVLHDLNARTWQQLTADWSPGVYDKAVLSGEGKVVAFERIEQDYSAYSILARHLGSTSNILIKAGGTNDSFEALTISSNGTLLAYEEWSWEFYDSHVFAYDFLTGSNELIAVATNGLKPNNSSSLLAVNATGRYVVFQGWASDLVPNDTNGWPDVFLRDRLTGQTELISLDHSGVGAGALPSIGPAAISPDGRYVMFVGATRETVPPEPPGFLTQIFVRDRVAGVTRRASVEPPQTQGDWFNANFASMSDDGRYVAYHSFDLRSDQADDRKEIVNVYLTDMQTGENTLVSANCERTSGGNAPSYWPRISGDGAFVFFFSFADNLVPGEFLPYQTNLFRWERANRRTTVVTANMLRTGGATGEHSIAGLSHDGGVLAFSSSATNLVFGNWESEIFVWTAGERPALSVNRANDLLTISWPADAPPSVLECKVPDGDWMPAEGEIDISNARHIYRTPIQETVGTRFFRLRLF